LQSASLRRIVNSEIDRIVGIECLYPNTSKTFPACGLTKTVKNNMHSSLFRHLIKCYAIIHYTVMYNTIW
jgi:hypothetical protein